MAAPVDFHGVHIDHPRGEPSRVYLAVTVGKSDMIREIPMTEDALIGLIADAAMVLRILTRANRPDA